MSHDVTHMIEDNWNAAVEHGQVQVTARRSVARWLETEVRVGSFYVS